MLRRDFDTECLGLIATMDIGGRCKCHTQRAFTWTYTLAPHSRCVRKRGDP